MKVALFGKVFSDDGVVYLQQLIDKLHNTRCRLVIYEPFFKLIKNKISIKCDVHLFYTHKELKDSADILFSIGGDGTLLDTITLVRDSGLPVLGVNLGRLGFLSSISCDEIIPSIDHITEGNFQLEQRTMLSLEQPAGLFDDLNFALNELSVTKTDNNSLAVVNVHIDNKFLNTYWADGLIVATTTGSTAYSLSCYGPIITPVCENFVITPISSHNLTVRPIVISDKSEIRISVGGRNRQYLVGLDSRFRTIAQNQELVIRKAAFKLNLVQLPNKDFYSTIREKLLWGKDQRN